MTKEDKALDKLFSQYIRMRAIKNVGGCERCLTPKFDTTREDGTMKPAWMSLQCSHYIGRANHHVRWDPDNAIGACGASHLYFTANPEIHRAFFKERLGARYHQLLARSRQTGKVDKVLIELYLKLKIKEVSE